MQSEAQRREFEARGIVRLPAAIPLADIEKMRDRLWEELEKRHGVSREDPKTWRVERPSGFKQISRSDAFAATRCPAVQEAAEEILGPHQLQPFAQPLVNFPSETDEWTVPHTVWHLDLSATALDVVPGLRVFTFLDEVVPRGGGTAVLLGSHRLVQRVVDADDDTTRLSSRKVRERLKRSEPWIDALFSRGDREERIRRFMGEDTLVGGVPLRVVEVTGAPGDIVLMDLRILHSLTPNVTDHPRLVIGQVIFRS